MTATITGIYRYPVKGLNGEALAEASLETGETIAGDRAYALGRPGLPFDAANPT